METKKRALGKGLEQLFSNNNIAQLLLIIKLQAKTEQKSFDINAIRPTDICGSWIIS